MIKCNTYYFQVNILNVFYREEAMILRREANVLIALLDQRLMNINVLKIW